MIKYTVVHATAAHAEELAPNLRDGDVAGIWAEQGLDALGSLLAQIAKPSEPMAGLADGKVMVLFGVETAAVMSDGGLVWMAAHRDLPKHSRAFLRACRSYIGHLRENYARIEVIVADDNKLSVRWREWLGFEWYEPVSFGPKKILAWRGRLA
jgi:hypothetical protein